MYIRFLIGLMMALLCAVSAAEKDEFSLNLNEVEIKAMIDTVSDITGKNFIVDPRVTGKVTVVTAKPMRAAQIYEIFQSILKVHGFSAINSGNIVKIVPNVNAKQEYTDTVVGDDALLTRMIQLHHVDAAEMVQMLTPLMPQHAYISAFPSSNVIILSDTMGNVNRLAQMINQMDSSGSSKFELINLNHATASVVVETLTKLITNRYSGKSGVFVPSIFADERTNSLLLGGDPASRRELRTLIADLDHPSDDSDGNTEVIYLHYAVAKELLETLTGIKGSKGGANAQPQTTVQKTVDIRADEATNALVITAPDEEMRSLKSVVRQLDIRRAQVHIEAIIAEVNYTKGQDIGVEWHTKVVNDGIAVRSSPVDLGSMITAAGKGLSIGYLVGSELRALLTAFAKDTNVNVLSTPSIVTLDNEEASMIVGQNIPIVSGSYTTNTSGSSNPFQTVQRQDIGIKLKVTPQINEGNAIKLKVLQEVSSVEPDPGSSSSSSSGVTINKREIDTSVLVDDGKILVLGGLIQDDVQESITKVPLLGDLPYLGHLFQFRESDVVKKNLMVFLRPVIMRDPEKSSILTNEKYNNLRSHQQRSGKEGVFLMPNEHAPILPEIPSVNPLRPPSPGR
ncbi:MAG: type II secretion system secretin GspD [Methylococcaceae bacterium]|nr:type II secretion system secretin GspD [Methylococcaceae bacterium]